MIISLANTKGGSGKTTAALLLAGELAANSSVTLIDADPRHPLTSWAMLPGKPDAIIVVKSGGEKTILDEIAEAEKASDAVIIDLEGTASRLTSYAMSQSDLVIIPAQEQHQDVEAALDVIAEIHREMRVLRRQIPYTIVLTRTKVVAKSRTARHIAKQFAENTDIPVLAAEINERDAYAALFAIGGTLHQLAAADVNNLKAAKANAKAVSDEILTILNSATKETNHAKATA